MEEGQVSSLLLLAKSVANGHSYSRFHHAEPHAIVACLPHTDVPEDEE